MLGADIFVLELERAGHCLIQQLVEPAAQVSLTGARAFDAGLLFQINMEFLLHLSGRNV